MYFVYAVDCVLFLSENRKFKNKDRKFYTKKRIPFMFRNFLTVVICVQTVCTGGPKKSIISAIIISATVTN